MYYAQRALKKCHSETSIDTAGYLDTRLLVTTSNKCESLMSVADLPLGQRRA